MTVALAGFVIVVSSESSTHEVYNRILELFVDVPEDQTPVRIYRGGHVGGGAMSTDVIVVDEPYCIELWDSPTVTPANTAVHRAGPYASNDQLVRNIK